MGTEQGIPSGLYTNEATCLGCGYRLRDLPEPRCPECGRPFDPDDPRTMYVEWWERQQREARRQRPPPTFSHRMTLAAVIGTSLLFCGPLGWMGLATWVGIWIAWRRRNGPPASGGYRLAEGSPRWRRNVVTIGLAGLALYLLTSVAYERCPHATTVRVGPVAISYSAIGGPCGNAPLGRGHRISGNWYISSSYYPK